MNREPVTQELVTGVTEGDEVIVTSALARGACPKVTVPSNNGSLACLINLAAFRGHHHLLPHLMQAGLSIEGRETYDKTPLMVAAVKGHTETVKALLNLGANPLATDSEGLTALHFAANWGWQECVAALLPFTPASSAVLEERTPVHLASYQGKVQILEQLAKAGWPLTARDSNGDTALHHAAGGGQVEAVQWLVQQGCDPLVKDKDGDTPLDVAMQCCCHEVETWLIKNGACGLMEGSKAENVDVKIVKKWRNRHEKNHNEVLSWLMEGNEAAIGNIPKHWDGHSLNRKGLTPLHAAALRGAPSGAVQALLGRGVSPHVFTPDNKDPAYLAHQEGHHHVIQALQTHQCQQGGADPKQLYEELLSTVSRGDHVQEVSSLLCKGAPLEPLGGCSVLRLAVTTNRARTVSLLLASGASLSANLLHEAWRSADVTHQVLASLTTAYCCRLKAEERRLGSISSAFLKGINNLIKTIKGNNPWQAQWKWDKDMNRATLSNFLAVAAAKNCPVTAAFLHRAGAWSFFSSATGASALHSALEAGHKGMAELLIRDLGASPYVPDTQNHLPLNIMTKKEKRRLEQKLFEVEREKLRNMELCVKADHEKEAARTALYIQKILFEACTISNVKFSLADVCSTLLLASRKSLLQLIHFMMKNECLSVDKVLDDISGTTALHQAASHGQDGCVELLLSAGAKLQQSDKYGQTPAHLAAMFGHKSTFELMEHREMQNTTSRAGTTAKEVKGNFKVLLSKYWKHNRKLHLPSDHHDPKNIIKNIVKSIGLSELQEMAKQVVVDLSNGEALEVKKAVLSEIGIIMNKVSAANPTYRGDIRLAGSSRDGSKLYAPDEFDINLVIHEDDIEVYVSKRAKEEVPRKGLLQISVKTDKAHLQGNRFMAGLYEEVQRCLAQHILNDERLSLVPPGLTSTQVGVALTMAWQGQEYPLLLIGVDLVPVLEVPWIEQVSRPFLTPEYTSTMQLSNAADGTWRCSFALTEADVLETLSPAERQVQLMGKVLLSCLKAEPWMPQHKKRFFKWFATREWNIAVPSGFCFKNALLRWLEQRQRKRVARKRKDNQAQELEAEQEGNYIQDLGARQERDLVKELEAGQTKDHAKELGTRQMTDHAQKLGAGQEWDFAKDLGAGQEGDHTQEMWSGQEGDHAQQLGAGQERDHAQGLGAGQEGNQIQESGTEEGKDTGQQFGVVREGGPARWMVQVFRLMCANPDESPEYLATENSSAYFGGECEGWKPGDGAPVIVHCLEEELEKLSA